MRKIKLIRGKYKTTIPKKLLREALYNAVKMVQLKEQSSHSVNIEDLNKEQ